jgi:hypothetical protein
MSLKDLQLPKSEVQIPGGGSFTVRGLSFTDLRTLFAKYSVDMNDLFELVTAGKGTEINAEDAGVAAATLLNKAPAMAADVICLAAGEPEAYETVLMLPFPVQTEALTIIGKATFGTEGGVKKFLQTASVLLGGLRASKKS